MFVCVHVCNCYAMSCVNVCVFTVQVCNDGHFHTCTIIIGQFDSVVCNVLKT